MPELPEVETTRRALQPHLAGRTISAVTLRTAKLRHPLDPDLVNMLPGKRLHGITRRGKYLLVTCDGGTLLIHLGMTGHLRLAPAGAPPGRYDHVEILLDNGMLLRLSDPRKFGSVIWVDGDPDDHPLLKGLGPEPLGDGFTPGYLERVCQGRKVAVKLILMNSRLLVGVGNIYANEALFRAGINPVRPAGSLDKDECARLAAAVREILGGAVARGEKTLETFLSVEEKPVYFPLEAMVYGRGGEPCTTCGTSIRQETLGNRSTFWCPVCQPMR